MIKHSIRNKLIVLLLIATIFPILTSIIVTYRYTKESVKKQTIRQNHSLMFQGKNNLEMYLNILDKAWISVYNDNVRGDTLHRVIRKGLDDYDSLNEIYRYLLSLSRTTDDVHQVYLYVTKSRRGYLMVNGVLKQAPHVVPENVYRTPRPFRTFVEATHMSHRYGTDEFPYHESKRVISLHRPIYEIPNHNLIGMVSIDVDINFLGRISSELYAEGEEEFYIFNQQGSVLYSSLSSVLGRRLDEPWINQILGSAKERGTLETKTSTFRGISVYEKLSTPYADWVLVKRIPYEYLYKDARTLTRINSMIVISFLVVAIAAIIVVSIRLTAPLKRMIRYMNQIESGNLKVDIAIKRKDEIGQLFSRFRQMMQTINHLILHKYQLEIANKTNQLKALQAQINPHFLNNVLQSIGALALSHKEQKIYSLIRSLGQMMRYQMHTGETQVSLKQEIEYVRHYLELQHQRFGDRMTYRFDLDLNLNHDEIQVPKLILQPLVENYFKHGFDPGHKEGFIRISTNRKENAVLIVVEDNGKGIPYKQLTNLQKILSEHEPDWEKLQKKKHIGLTNVLLRLKLYFYHRAHLDIANRSPRGVRVRLWIPFERGGISNESTDR